ncbi:MAG: STAS domain-containing protein [Pseudomonadota bacterium]|nr:STAS domain-containing protein [Pseudomonadota bacterium]
MKTSKRKRSAKAAPVVELSDVLAAKKVDAAPVVEAVAGTVAVAAEPDVADEPIIAAVAEPLDGAADFVDPTAETVVADAADLGADLRCAAEPAQAGEPLVVLAANCSVKDAAALKISLCAVASEDTAVTVDVSAVERVDTATLQLLCAFARDRIGRKQKVTWRGESQALRDAVRLLGVGALLGFESNGVAA